jgi:hypothetical protein
MEIYIKKNEVNRFVLTLNESSTLTNPNYLFIFKNVYNVNSVEIPFTTDDLSDYTCRYDLFELSENVTGSTTGGISVPLSLMSGQYVYDVYESTTQTLDISATTGNIITSGRLTVDDTTGMFTNEVIPTQNNNSPSIYD